MFSFRMIYKFIVYFYLLHGLSFSDEESSTVKFKGGTTFIGLTFLTEEKQKTIYSFRGIPYAMPPIGERRFKPPVPLPEYLSTTVRAHIESPSCAQPIMPFVVIGEEDCLYLNVYTPKVKCDTLLPVMVWIHGGFFEIGGHTLQTFRPDYFLNEDVIVVTVNYRLNIFGFLNTEDMESPGNYGLKDQILALKWVKKYIKYFCGNDSNITIFGESAGSVLISYLSQSPLTEGLFQQAIMQSGTSLCLWGLTRNPRKVAFDIGKMLSLNTSSSVSLLDDLRKMKFEDLIAICVLYQLKILILQPAFDGFTFGPSIEPDHDGAVITNISHQNLANGGYHKIPYIIGLTSGEAYPFITLIGEYVHWYLTKLISLPTALVPESMNIKNYFEKLLVNNKIKSYYFKNTLSEVEGALNYFNDNEFVRPILESIQLYSKDADVYMYVFSYKGSFKSITNEVDKSVGHGEDKIYLFHNTFMPNVLNKEDKITRRRLLRLWTNFAKTGNPTPNKDMLLQNALWKPTKSTSGTVYLDIGKNVSLKKNFQIDSIKFWKSLFKLYGNPPYGTY